MTTTTDPEPIAHCAVCGRSLIYVPEPAGRWYHALSSRPRLAARDEDAGYAIGHDCEPTPGRFEDCLACARTMRDRRAYQDLSAGDHFAGMPAWDTER